MLKENQLIKATNMHSKSESIAVLMADQVPDKTIRVMCVATFREYDIEASQITCYADAACTKDTPISQIKWLPINK